MAAPCDRRRFLRQLAGCGALAAGRFADNAARAADVEVPKAAPHTLTVITGKPRERGRQYGRKFKDAIQAFYQREVLQVCTETTPRDVLFRYAGQCGRAVEKFSPIVTEELQGLAEGAGLKWEEAILLTLHEEIAGPPHKGGRIPTEPRCTAVAVGPPETRDGHTYVGQNWDWMTRVYGLSSMLQWKRPEGPSLLTYSYPGLWVGAGVNAAGLAFCWTWGEGLGIKGPRVGIPSYVLIAQMLYQATLADALQEVERAHHAGWFVLVLGDDKGNLALVEATPEKLLVQRPRGHVGRASYASQEIFGGGRVKLHPQCKRILELLEDGKGKYDEATLKSYFADHQCPLCIHPNPKKGFTVDSMLFNCNTREAHVTRGPVCTGQWRTFRLEE